MWPCYISIEGSVVYCEEEIPRLYSPCRSDNSILYVVFDVRRQEDHSPNKLLSRKEKCWLGPRLKVLDAGPCSFQSEIMVWGGERGPPRGYKETYWKDIVHELSGLGITVGPAILD
ncbi:hypothetical protein TNCV_4743411 [Trichonephila clavipes]|nr:hypothetical protein TNCV_4743411 [Trichonephila clavipes]